MKDEYQYKLNKEHWDYIKGLVKKDNVDVTLEIVGGSLHIRFTNDDGYYVTMFESGIKPGEILMVAPGE